MKDNVVSMKEWLSNKVQLAAPSPKDSKGKHRETVYLHLLTQEMTEVTNNPPELLDNVSNGDIE